MHKEHETKNTEKAYIALDIQHRTKGLTGLFIHTGGGTEQTAKQDTVDTINNK